MKKDRKTSSFLEAILAHPDDDAPRLVYADWLDETGDAGRAEFIRVQVERAARPTWDVRQVALRLREQVLLAQHEPGWRAELPFVKGVTWGVFRRGFVATAEFNTFAALRDRAAACWAATPLAAAVVRWPRQRDVTKEGGPIAGLRELTVAGTLVDAGDAVRLAASPVLSTLRTLTVQDANLSYAGFRQLVGSPHLGRLAALRLPYNSIGNTGIRLLVTATTLPALAELDLSEAGSYGRYGEDPIIDEEGLTALAAWRGLARLHTLKLAGNDARDDGLRILLLSPYNGGLKHLVVRDCSIDADTADAFDKAQPGLKLDVLDLGENLLRVEGAGHLATADCLRELKALQLDRCELGPAAARKLVKAPFMNTLQVLDLNFNSLGPTGLAALLGAKPAALHSVRLQRNDLTDAAVDRLAKSPAATGLRSLDLQYNHLLTDPAAMALAESPHLDNLLDLRLAGNQFSKAGEREFRKSPLGQRLAALDVPDESPFTHRSGEEDIPF